MRLGDSDSIIDPVGTEVMGMTENEVLFKGVITKVVSRFTSIPDILRVEGTLYYGFADETSHFNENLPVAMLRTYNEHDFSKLQDYMIRYASAIASGKYYKKECRKLLG